MQRGSVKEFVKNRQNVCNLVIFILLCISCNFCYYLLNFYIKYIPGDIFVNQTINSISEAFAVGPLAVIISAFFSVKTSYVLTLALCAISCLAILMSIQLKWVDVIPFSVLGAKASVTTPFCILYFSTLQFFSTRYLGLVLGLYNMLGRITTVSVPMVAEMPEPIPMATCIILCAIATMSACMLKKQGDDGEEGQEKEENYMVTVEF